jgi:hypothetical protein
MDKKVSGKKRARVNKPATDEPSEKKKAKKAKRDDRQTRAALNQEDVPQVERLGIRGCQRFRRRLGDVFLTYY